MDCEPVRPGDHGQTLHASRVEDDGLHRATRSPRFVEASARRPLVRPGGGPRGRDRSSVRSRREAAATRRRSDRRRRARGTRPGAECRSASDGRSAHRSTLDDAEALSARVAIRASVLLVQKLQRALECLRRVRRGSTCPGARACLPVQVEAAVRVGYGAHPCDVSVVELDELQRFTRSARIVVVRLEERLRIPGSSPRARSRRADRTDSRQPDLPRRSCPPRRARRTAFSAP